MRVSRFNLFLAVQTVLYIAFLSLDLTGKGSGLSTGLKYSVIVLCLVYVLMKRVGNGLRDLSLLRTAFLFTLLSDTIILFLDPKYYLYGVFSFIIVQQLYGIRLNCRENRGRGYPEVQGIFSSLLLRLGTELASAAAILVILSLAEVKPDRLMIASVFYFICLVHNAIHGCISALTSRRKTDMVFAVGLVLFLLCDINVGLFNLSEFIPFTGNASEVLYRFASILMWTFYAPSQVLIAASSDSFRQ